MSNNPSNSPRRRHAVAIAAILVAGLLAGVLILNGNTKAPAANGSEPERSSASDDGHGHPEGGDASHGDVPAAKGPNGGSLFVDGDVSLELLFSEESGALRMKAWAFDKSVPLNVSDESLAVKLVRPNGEEEVIRFKRADGALISTQTVAEPHAFDATIELKGPQKAHSFNFGKDEGKVSMSDAQVEAAGITLEEALPATIESGLQFPGEIRFNEDRTAHVVARVPGVVESVSANLGQQVKKGQVLAVISSTAVSDARAELQSASQRRSLAQSTYEREKRLFEERISPEQDVLVARQTLREVEIAVANANQKLLAMGATPNSRALGRFELRAPFDGVVVEKHAALGEAVTESTQTFIISDLSEVWAEMSVPARELPRVRVGEKVTIKSGAFDAKATGTVAYVGALIGEQTRTALARVVLPNPQGAWRPGLFVNVEVMAAQAPAPVTVASSAIQTIEGKSVVFIKIPGGFLPQPVRVGRSDGQRVEIVGGMKAGTSYAADGSFVVKSEQGKGTATHTH
ncbi:efflux RND transporter periplasmic adaptor subunit [Variovorax dokdonensis]|uniref:Efflux RND transporter periplasmic adaptor subunit n=1 Tax=Variovorax dokdonensis TaxID=344883 RepID=A0ABT7NGL3_9BURK|nr:efflux RND transporter periplasmic adaptor subunit [Variovorax dokdonensis]MDM0047020.1 efflux RND transporter periplasmic adaptor subunit [Variovorax dokdonensis]